MLRGFAGAKLRSSADIGAMQAHAVLAATRDWRRGWALHEARRYSPAVFVPAADIATRWDGVDRLADLAIIDEQGLGDAVLMARWIPWLVEYTGRAPRFYGRAALRRWIEATGCEFIERPAPPAPAPAAPPARANARDTAADSDAFATSAVALSMSLPDLAQCAAPDDVPAPFAPPALLRARARHLDRANFDARRRIGICWTSTAANLNKQLRFLPEQFDALWTSLHGVDFVNLTHEARVSAGAPFGVRRFADVYETGELLASLDLVVTVDTLVAHLAGSLCVPTIVIAPTYYDWRYRWPGEDGSPFYPSVTVFRQQTGDDVSVLSRVRAHLEATFTSDASDAAGGMTAA